MELTLNLVRYYVYAYTDLEKPGHYIIYTSKGKVTFTHEPVYIGKGTDVRMESHQHDGKNKRLKDFLENGSYDCFKIYSELPSHDAYQLESELIYKIGRIDLGKGPLVNESTGVHLPETREDQEIGPYHLEFNKMIHVMKALNSKRTIKEAAEALEISERTLYRYTKGYRLEKIDGDWVQV